MSQTLGKSVRPNFYHKLKRFEQRLCFVDIAVFDRDDYREEKVIQYIRNREKYLRKQDANVEFVRAFGKHMKSNLTKT